jgi:hypothetical protein
MENIARFAHVTRQSDNFAVVCARWLWAISLRELILFTHQSVNFIAIDFGYPIIP